MRYFLEGTMKKEFLMKYTSILMLLVFVSCSSFTQQSRKYSSSNLYVDTSGKQLNIFVLDDEPLFVNLFTRQFKSKEKNEVLLKVHDNLADGLKFVNSTGDDILKYHFVVLDYSVLENGKKLKILEDINKIKNDHSSLFPIVILYTASGLGVSDREKLMNKGFDLIFLKGGGVSYLIFDYIRHVMRLLIGLHN